MFYRYQINSFLNMKVIYICLTQLPQTSMESLTCLKYKKNPSADRMRMVFVNYDTQETELLYEFQYITGIVKVTVSQIEADVE